MPSKDPEARAAASRRHDIKRNKSMDALAGLLQERAELPEPPSRDRLMRALGVQAEKGNVPAIRLLLEEYRKDERDAPAPDANSFSDELAQRRVATG